MKRTLNKRPRGIWTEDENKYLIRLVEENQHIKWNELAQRINEKYGGGKSGKQCRERYRNYGNPKIDKSGWKKNEKLLFTILHKIHGNQWTNIAKYLNSRSDVVIKNYFYCVIRKATKCLHTQIIPASFINKPEKFYRIYTILEHIKSYYLSEVNEINNIPKYGHKGKIILELLKSHKVTDALVYKYQQLMLNTFKENYGTANIPIVINVTLESFNISENKAKELCTLQNTYNTEPLNRLMVIKISNNYKEVASQPSLPLVSPETPLINNDYSPYSGETLLYPQIQSYPTIQQH